jgi:predicted DNA-binding transcriptional regulator AlpA
MPDHPEVSIVPRWLTKAMAARYLTLSETTFDDNIRAGAFPPAIRLPTGSLKMGPTGP